MDLHVQCTRSHVGNLAVCAESARYVVVTTTYVYTELGYMTRLPKLKCVKIKRLTQAIEETGTSLTNKVSSLAVMATIKSRPLTAR